MKLYNGDCLEIMKLIPDKSIDAIITDPPYGTTACKWDSIIPFEPMWKQLNRIIKDNGAIVLFGSEPFSSYLRVSNIKNYRYDWVWDKKRTTGFGNCNRQPLRQYELIHIFYKKQPTYNPMPYPKKVTKSFTGKRKFPKVLEVYGKSGVNNTKMTDSEFGYPRNIITQIPVMNNLSKDKSGLHPTQKPVALMEYLIKTYTNEFETILDFTMGSGTTGVACCNTNRDFIGIELDKDYFKIAEERIKNEL